MRDLDSPPGLERFNRGIGELQGPLSRFGGDGRRLTFPEGVQNRINMGVEGALKFPVEIVEVTGLPDFRRFVADGLKGLAPNGVLDE